MSAQQKYEDALNNIVSQGFVSAHEAKQWIISIKLQRESAKKECIGWNLSMPELEEICLRVFGNANLI